MYSCITIREFQETSFIRSESSKYGFYYAGKRDLIKQQALNRFDSKDYTLAVLMNAIDELDGQKVAIRSLLIGERWQRHSEEYFLELTLSGGWIGGRI